MEDLIPPDLHRPLSAGNDCSMKWAGCRALSCLI